MQGVYQTFDIRGEALSDPLPIGVAADYRDFGAYAHSVAIGPENQVYLLWSIGTEEPYSHFITILDSTGQVLEPRIELPGLNTPEFYSPILLVDSQGNLAVIMNQIYHHSQLFYCRYRPNGEMIDTIHAIGSEDQFVAYLYAAFDRGDTLHVLYQENINDVCHGRYSKITPVDEFMVEDMPIDEVAGQWGVVVRNINFDNQGRVLFNIFSFTDQSQYLMRMGFDLEPDLELRLGRCEFGSSGSAAVDREGNIHIFAGFRGEPIAPWRESLCYLEVSEEGGILDSLQLIHSSQESDFCNPWIFISRSGIIALIWEDNRHAEGRPGAEFYMRYSSLESPVPTENYPAVSTFLMEPNFPNPFNGTTRFRIQAFQGGEVSIVITDLLGRQLFEDCFPSAGCAQYAWNGADHSGNLLPGGTYMLTVSNGRDRQTRLITLLR